MRNTIAFDTAEDVFVDKVLARNLRECGAGRQSLRHLVCQAARLGGFVALFGENPFVRLVEFVLIDRRLLRSFLLLCRNLSEHDHRQKERNQTDKAESAVSHRFFALPRFLKQYMKLTYRSRY